MGVSSVTAWLFVGAAMIDVSSVDDGRRPELAAAVVVVAVSGLR